MHARALLLLVLLSVSVLALAEEELGTPGDDALRQRIEQELEADLSARVERQFSEFLLADTTALLEAAQRKPTATLAMRGSGGDGMRCLPSKDGVLVCVVGAGSRPAAAAPAALE